MMPTTDMTALVLAHQADLRAQADQARLAKLARHGSRRQRNGRRPRWWLRAMPPFPPSPERSPVALPVSGHRV
jgi:hypothetical protein